MAPIMDKAVVSSFGVLAARVVFRKKTPCAVNTPNELTYTPSTRKSG